MKRLLLTLSFLCSLLFNAGAQRTYSGYNNTEGGTSGSAITTTILQNSWFTNSSDALYGTWSISPSPHTRMFVTNVNDQALRGSINVGSTYFDGASDTKSFFLSVPISNTEHKCQFDLATRTGQIAFGFYWRFGTTSDLGNYIDIFHINLGGDYLVCAFINGSGGNKVLRVHTNTGDTYGWGAGVGAPITLVANKTYWVTGLMNTNNGVTGTAKLAIFDPATWLIVPGPGGTNISELPFATRGMAEYFKFGHLNTHDCDEVIPMWFDDFIYKLGPTAVTEWPLLPPGGTITASSTSRANFDFAYTNAQAWVGTNRDLISIPSGSANWSSRYDLGKNGLIVKAAGTNTTALTRTGTAADAMFDLTGDFVVVTNVSILGSGSEFYTGIRFSGNFGRAGYVYMSGLSNCFLVNMPAVVHNFSAGNAFRVARIIYNTAFYDAHYPMSYTDTNTFCIEDGVGFADSGKSVTGSIAWMTSQQGHAWQSRNVTWVLNNASCDIAPGFDSHGDDAGSGIARPGTSVLINSNRVVILAGQHNGKFADIRGGESSISSNQVIWSGTIDGLVYREERPSDSPNYHVTGPSRYWQNYSGASGTTAMTVDNEDPSIIIPGLDLTNAAPAVFEMVQYPHPLRGIPSAGGGGGGDVGGSYTPGPPRVLKVIRLKKS